ncbi:MAG TPA: CpaF family protein [Phenylobacterium sp.]|jgi:pilus assembly protein CpaF|uniref:CpaF family protein n=1 Tax=Phenylobacterium sp. TaxID=1871053 RepID=UPI002CFED686|nr:CpaF family protein [Phenylobacterium sp.]HXA41179.1 CpaF family protein [Phenylobacterium sp.]
MGRFSLPGARPATPPPAPAAAAPAPAPAPPVSALPTLASPPPPPMPPKHVPAAKGSPPSQLDIRLRLHARLIEELDLAKLDKLDEKDMRREVLSLVADFARDERMALNTADLQELGASIYDEMVGLGPLEPLLKDESINDILINGPFQVYVERRGELELTAVRFRDNDHLLRIVNRIVAGVGRRIDESQPMVDARLQDGSRVNAAIAPIAIDGAAVSIRKFSKKPLTLERLVEFNAMPMAVADFIHGAVKSRVSTVISGGTGSGKTTLLNALSAAISHGERLITIEDAAELQLQQPHVVRLETRPPNIEGKGEIRQRELVKNALRMRPDRVILGEVRADEAFDMLQAMNTGHEGSMATIHANNPREAIGRLEQMIAMGGLAISPDAMRQQIASAIGLIIQVMRLSDGKRKITHVTEITGMEGQVVQMQDIFTFNRTHTDPDGTVHGEFRATGLRPRCIDEMNRRGIPYDLSNFDPTRALGVC